MKKKKIILIEILVFLTLFLSFVKKTIAQSPLFSPKKGVAGGATLQTLTQTNTAWFYNWGYTPGYKTTSGFNNWDPLIWEKFVPSFYGHSYNSVDSQITEICAKTNYCHKGNYYIVGNEPDIAGEDLAAGSVNPALDAVVSQGEIIQRIRSKDSSAKFIVLGLSSKKEDFIRNYIIAWKSRWQGTTIADLSTVAAGWHFHTYGDYRECLTSDAVPRDFLRVVNYQMQTTFGRLIPNQELWITEMGSLDNIPPPYPSSAGRDAFKNRMSCLTNIYESSPVITRYAWFYFGCNSSVHIYQDCNKDTFSPYNLFFPPDAYCGDLFCITDLGLTYTNLPSSVSPTSTPRPSSTLVFTIKFPQITGNNTSPKTATVTLKQSGLVISNFDNVAISNLNDGTGRYRGTISNITPGSYAIYIKGWSHLRKLMQSNVNLLSGINQYDWSTIILTNGDTNNDNIIMLNDITGIISVWSQSNTPVTSANQQYDLNLDGVISLTDITSIISNWTASEVRGE